MQYSDIKSKVYLFTKSNVNSIPDATMVILVNNALERVESMIMRYDGRWNWDDSNQIDLPIATTSLVTSQQDYSILTSFLNVLRVELKDSNGNWIKLEPFDQSDLKYQTITDYMKTSGTPRQYDLIGNSIFLYPAPNYTQADSLKIYYQRPPSYFVAADTTKQPGINPLYHNLIALYASYDYAIANGLKNANQLMASIQVQEDSMEEDYSNRLNDEPLRLTISTPYGSWWGGFGGWRSGR